MTIYAAILNKETEQGNVYAVHATSGPGIVGALVHRSYSNSYAAYDHNNAFLGTAPTITAAFAFYGAKEVQ